MSKNTVQKYLHTRLNLCFQNKEKKKNTSKTAKLAFIFWFKDPLLICFGGWFAQDRFEKLNFETN